MKQLLFITFILIVSCSTSRTKEEKLAGLRNRSFHYDSISGAHLQVDSLELIYLIKKGDEILGADVSTDISHRKGTKFHLIETLACGKNKWHVILKESVQGDLFLRPYKGLFLILQNVDNRVIGAVKLTEYFDILLITSWESKFISQFINDSTLVGKNVSRTCSDVVSNGKAPCWEITITSQWTLTCDKFVLDKSETTKVEM